MTSAIPDAILYGLFFLSVAFIIVAKAFTKALLEPIIFIVGKIPFAGGIASDFLQTVEQSILNALGTAEGKIDHVMGVAFHKQAQLLAWLWREIKSHAGAIATIAEVLGGVYPFVAGTKALINRLTRHGHATTRQTARVERELHHLQRQVKALEHDVSKGIGNDVLPQLKVLDREIAKIRHKDVPAIQAGEQANAGEITNLWQWVKDHTLVTGTAAFAGAVAWALGRLGLNSIRCGALSRMFNRRGCGLWNGLEDVLGLLFDGLILADLCTVIPAAEKLFAEFEAPLVDLISHAANAVCAKPPKTWETLAVPTLHLPTSGEIIPTL